jgi:hypothetical protein
MRRTLLFVLLLFVAQSLAVWGQETRGTILGRVTDPSGAGVTNAKVTATNVATNEQTEVETSAGGDYTVPFVRPGRYTVEVSASGFKKVVRENVEVRVGDKITVDVPMEVGNVVESVVVKDAPPLIETATASRGAVIDNVRVTELPLNGRNPINFTNLSPGVVYNGNPQFTRPFDNGDNINFSINGGVRQSNAFLLDGAPNDAITDTSTDRTRGNLNIAYIPTVDAVQEFKVITNFYDAQYGRTGGGIINVSTKSGQNDLHGTAYWFLRRYQLEANNIAANAAGRPRYAVDPITGENLGGRKLDQAGTQLSGPLWIPGLYNGKDKTFWSFGFEDYRESAPGPVLTSVPSLQMRQGNFSNVGVPIFDPLSTQLNPNFDPNRPDNTSNPRYIRTQFPGNIITPDRFSPVGRSILNSYPAPNTGAPNAVFNNFIASPNLSEDKFRNWIARVDQNFSEKWRMYFRYAYNRRDQFDNGANGFSGPGQDAQDPLVRQNHTAVADSVHVLGPRTILDIRAGYTRFIQAAYRTSVTGIDITQFGFPASFASSRFTDQPPRIEVSQYPAWGARNPSQNTTNLISLTPSLSLNRGKHSMRAGADLRNYRPNVFGGSFLWGSGQFGFDSTFTQRLPAFSDGSGNAMAALLLGYPSSGVVQNVPRLAFNWNYYAMYFQDDWRITNRLSVNLGLRYDIEGSPYERYNRQNRGFAFDQASPLASAVRNANPADCPACANLRGGLLFAGVGGQPEAVVRTEYDHWQPRIGVAYQLASKTVLRGGYGLFYLPVADYGGTVGFGSDTPYISTLGGGINAFLPANSLSNPYPNGLLPPTGSSAGLSTFLGRNIAFNLPDRSVPYVHSYSVGIQHQLPWNIVIDASYVGSRTMDVNTNTNNGGNARNINVNTVEQLARANQDATYFSASVTNPFAGLVPGTALNNPTISRQQLLLPFPQFTTVLQGLEPIGRLWYDSLQLNVEKRYSAGLVVQGAYTWSKNIEALTLVNNQDPTPQKVLAAQDRPHRLVLSAVYQLPFGRGRAIGTNVGRGWNQVIGGWEVTTLGIIQSGTPINLPSNYNLIGDPRVSDQSFQRWFSGCELLLNGTTRQPNAARTGFETGCSNPVWQQRNTGTTLAQNPLRSSNIRNPWAKQWDLSINKRFVITERVNFQFRAEAFNAFNTPIRPNPNTDPNSTQFGFVSVNQSNFPRQIQFGFKLNF